MNNVWVQLKVTSSDGITITDVRRIIIYDDEHPKCMWRIQKPDKERQFSTSHELLLVPNPANTSLQVRWQSDTEADCEILVTDCIGRLLTIQRTIQIRGENIIHVDSSAFSEGLYTVSLRTESRLMTQKLLIVH